MEPRITRCHNALLTTRVRTPASQAVWIQGEDARVSGCPTSGMAPSCAAGGNLMTACPGRFRQCSPPPRYLPEPGVQSGGPAADLVESPASWYEFPEIHRSRCTQNMPLYVSTGEWICRNSNAAYPRYVNTLSQSGVMRRRHLGTVAWTGMFSGSAHNCFDVNPALVTSFAQG
jgi:hypothetical protein